VTGSDLGRDIVIIACAVSAGIHAALFPHHFAESAAAGGGFIAATGLLAVLIVGLTYRPGTVASAGAALVFAGLLASYALALTSGVPFLQPEAEPVDALGLLTKVVEAIGLAVALDLIRSGRTARRPFSLTRTGGVRA
jgi:hypothetical protein